ncbi:hypothetical protein PoB_002622800 [Plakobranchus ocellatus]|uniref:Uncharacterized protein n=1 Tax=Plakobranchus ocellatus TaxID=259542 RepID=A0AAV3ZXV7_9GAST|nr:hypothetical protein PoB_002622800 [Plakobranchus ocellatus]
MRGLIFFLAGTFLAVSAEDIPTSCTHNGKVYGNMEPVDMDPCSSCLCRATDVGPGCKTQRIAPTLRQVADLVCTRTKEREYYKTRIVGHVNCYL